MILVTGANRRYYERIKPYLASLKRHATFPYKMVSVGWFSENPDHIPLSLEQNLGAPPETESIQHGSFLHILKTPSDEVILYTDGDFIMQRQIDPGEAALLHLKDNQVCTGYNFGEQCTLFHDAHLLDPINPYDRLEWEWGTRIYKAQDYNAGFLAMTRKTWEEVYQFYMMNWERVSSTFRHQARQQWLISWIIDNLKLEVILCPWSLHAHGHGGLKEGMERREGQIFYKGKLACFRHFL